METRVLLGCLAALSAAGASFALFFALSSFVLRRRASFLQEDGTGLGRRIARWYLRNGISFLVPLADVLMRSGRVRHAAEEAVQITEEKGVFATCRAIVSVFLLVSIGGSLIVGVVFQSFIGACAVQGCMAIGALMAMTASAEKRREQVQAEVPRAIESFSACFGAGYTLYQTLERAAHDLKGPLAHTFERAARVLELGGTTEQALADLRSDVNSAELAFLAVALDVQHQAGGSLHQVLEAVAEASKGELELKRTLKVQTAQAKLSARIVAVMPLILVTAFSLISPTFLLPFFSSLLGYVMLACALAMQVAGIFLVRRALKVEVGA